MAGCAAFPEVSYTDNADNRAVWSDFQTFFLDGQAVCQYYGRAYDGAGTGVRDFCDGQAGTGHQWFDDGHRNAFRTGDKLSRASGGLHTGIRLHDALCRLHRNGASGGTQLIINKLKL